MALSPWMATGKLEIRVAAALLAGISPHESDLTFNNESNDYNQWRVSLVNAALCGELKSDWAGEKRDEQGRPSRTAKFDPWPQDVWAWIEKPSLHKWLIEKGIPESDIPLEIRTYPTEGTLDDAPESKELRALEALGLLAEALAQRHPSLYGKTAGAPKKSGIYSIMMDVVDGYESPKDEKILPIKIQGFKKSTLNDLLGDAIEAWEQKKM